jgi:hypothetical protein
LIFILRLLSLSLALLLLELELLLLPLLLMLPSAPTGLPVELLIALPPPLFEVNVEVSVSV